ncbi:4Fe-4S single cluster domain-containing protein [Pelagibaculum spongiae]|uniref:Anaerobic ribonucleoside-triphosphate reductase-activating protein n=1 Tax=Pelagibaculum spongiae TaxID=2080658 RepID=A0A2V1H1Z2_9GAMM|nr:4Fe-4S single cluster domain-containing protein [Pelagibaculum spongiae]PVZ68916.1 radical SAM protein [Pelagibaculum spongiae]
MFDTHFNIAHVESSSHIYGPGNRFVIWLQGCTLACKGCWNTAMWPHKENRLIERSFLLKQIIKEKNIEGITFLGGEPLQQCENVRWLISKIKMHNLSAMLYTGYEWSEIKANQNHLDVCNSTDILITGRFLQNERNTNLLWRGSDNQIVNFISNKYSSLKLKEVNQVEITIEEDGALKIYGYPDQLLLDQII